MKKGITYSNSLALLSVILFIAGLILGNIGTNISKNKELDSKTQEIVGLNKEINNIKDYLATCTDDKDTQKKDYENKLQNKQDLLDLYKIKCGVGESNWSEESLGGKYDDINGYFYYCGNKIGEEMAGATKLYVKLNGTYQQVGSALGKTCDEIYYTNLQDRTYCSKTNVSYINQTKNCWIKW